MTEKEQIAFRLIRVFKQLKKDHDTFMRNYGPEDLSPAQSSLMHILWGETKNKPEGIRVSELSKTMCVTPSSITQLINSLEKKKLIKRTINEKDRRYTDIQLTEAGLECLKKHKKKLLENLNDLVEHLGYDRTLNFIETLEEINKYNIERGK